MDFYWISQIIGTFMIEYAVFLSFAVYNQAYTVVCFGFKPNLCLYLH